MARYYAPHRRAHFPRLWPILLAAVLPVLAFSTFLPDRGPLPRIIAEPVFAALWTSLVVGVRLWLWRRAHPIISPRQYLDDLRAKARWN